MPNSRVQLVVPSGPMGLSTKNLAKRQTLKRGVPIGILTNGKLNAAPLLTALASRLMKEYGVPLIQVDKERRGSGVSAAGLERLQECQAVVVGVGD